MPEDDLPGDADDGSSYTPPLPPEDRLWRHPSELGAARSGLRVEAPPPRGQRRVGAALTALAGGLLGSIVTVGLLAVVGAFDTRVVHQRLIEQPPGPESLQFLTGLDTGTADAAALARRAEPALVRVEATTPLGVMVGTAVAVSSEHLLTSADVLRRAEPSLPLLTVMPDGSRVEAEVVAEDRYTNLAVLRVAGADLQVPSWGSSDGLVAGSDVLVVGAAEQNARSATVSRGVISSLGIRTTVDNGVTLHDLLRLDANMVPVTRGGVVLDLNGDVIGVVSTIAKDDGGSERIGYATPIELARLVTDSVVRYGRPTEVWLGVDGQSLTTEEASTVNLTGGALITSVTPQGPAQVAGLAQGDVITAIDQDPVDTFTALILALRSHSPGEPVVVSIVRAGEIRLIPIYLGRRPAAEQERAADASPGEAPTMPM